MSRPTTNSTTVARSSLMVCALALLGPSLLPAMARADKMRDELALTRFTLGLALEFDDVVAQRGYRSEDARFIYRPTAYFIGLYPLRKRCVPPRCSMLGLGMEVSAAHSARTLAGGDLRIDVSKIWLAGTVEFRWQWSQLISAHARARAGFVPTRLHVHDRVAQLPASDWAWALEGAGLFGLRFFSLLVVETGLGWEWLPEKTPFFDGGALDHPDDSLFWLLRFAFELRFGEPKEERVEAPD